MIRFARISLAMFALAPLCACALMSAQQHPADDIYVLKAKALAASASALPVSLRVVEPEAAPGLDTERIAVSDSPNHLTHYTGAAWAQPLPQMAQAFFVEALQQSRRFKTVSDDQQDVSADVILLIDIRDFEVVNSASSPKARVGVSVKLARAGNRQIIAAFPIDKTVTASANHMPEIVAAFNGAMNQAAAEIVRQSVAALGKMQDHPSKP